MSLLAADRNNKTIQGIRPGTVQTVAVGAASAATGNAMQSSPQTTIARIVSTTACHYRLGNVAGTPPVALATDTYLPAGVVEFISVGKNDKIAFIQDSASGIAYVTEGA